MMKRASFVLLLALVTLQLIVTATADVWEDPYGEDAAFFSQDQAASSGENGATYDYIVVGGGSAGAVAAARLSERSSNSVLLLDGGDRSQSSVGGTDFVQDRYRINNQGDAVFQRPLTRYDVPALSYSVVSDYPNSPTPPYPLYTSFGGVVNTTSKILGGASVHNYMVFDRVSPKSINSWGVSGWSFNDVLPFFKKSEDVRGLGLDPAYRGFNGPTEINFAQAKDPAGDVFINACVNAGYPFVKDFNNPNDYLGCGQPQFNINDRGIRASSVNQYLAPALKRSNLKLRVNSLAVKVLFDNSNPPKATGVRYVRNGVTYTANARKEILLSAGAFNTPKLLMLSGVGPSAHLRSLNIPVVANLPVGKRMAIHPIVFAFYEYNITGRNIYNIAADSVEYAINGTGIFASTGTFAEGKIKTKPSLNDFDAHVLIGTNVPNVVQFASLLWGSKQNNGTITLTSNDYRDPPFFDFTPYDNQDDLQATVDTIKFFRRIKNTYPANVTFGRETVPGPQYRTDAQLRQYIKNGGGIPIITHLHGGAVLGNTNDNNSVLDPRMRVKRVRGLRVSDMSVIPGLFLGGPMANGIMLGERVSDFILADNP